MLPGLDISYADPAQHIYDITAAGEDLFLDYLDHDLPVRPLKGFRIQLQCVCSVHCLWQFCILIVYINGHCVSGTKWSQETYSMLQFHADCAVKERSTRGSLKTKNKKTSVGG